MRVFVSEFICGGALAGALLPDSLRREGRAMLWAIVADLLRIPMCRVVTTLDARLANEAMSRDSGRSEVVLIADPAEERREFERLASASDAVLVIAPETDGILVQRVRRAGAIGTRTLNCSPEAIELCGDKLRLAEHLEHHALPTIPTTMADFRSDEPLPMYGLAECCRLRDGWVVKPRDGAGSWLTFSIPAAVMSSQWRNVAAAYKTAGVEHKAILQPFIAGQPLSVGCLCSPNGEVEVFPIGRQCLSAEFQYRGGSIPAELPTTTVDAIRYLVRRACATIAGLGGYIGFDLLLPEADPARPVIVEINPRLTTSYIGYRQLCTSNLAERWLQTVGQSSEGTSSTLMWSDKTIEFTTTGG